MKHVCPIQGIRHYDGGETMYVIRTNSLAKLDRFGLALANAGHIWSPRLRKEFEKRVRELKREKGER